MRASCYEGFGVTKLCTSFRIYYLNLRLFLYFFLAAYQVLGAACKQMDPRDQLPFPLLHKIPIAFQKNSGLSVISPAVIDGANFFVEPASVKNVTTQVGQTTYLHCIVDTTEDQTVSWIRLRDFHLLTVGSFTYTSDTRFKTMENDYSNDWTLQIKYPQASDEGVYECQISTDPPTSHHVNLKVLVPKSQVLGGPNFYVSVGSELNLTCVISDCPEPPAYVFWYHDGRMINYDHSKRDISIQKAGEDTTVSRLHINNAQQHDSGNYSCSPSNTDTATIFVHVLSGEKHAAVQNDASPTSRSARFTSSLHAVSIVESLMCVFLVCVNQRISSTR